MSCMILFLTNKDRSNFSNLLTFSAIIILHTLDYSRYHDKQQVVVFWFGSVLLSIVLTSGGHLNNAYDNHNY